MDLSALKDLDDDVEIDDLSAPAAERFQSYPPRLYSFVPASTDPLAPLQCGETRRSSLAPAAWPQAIHFGIVHHKNEGVGLTQAIRVYAAVDLQRIKRGGVFSCHAWPESYDPVSYTHLTLPTILRV